MTSIQPQLAYYVLFLFFILVGVDFLILDGNITLENLPPNQTICITAYAILYDGRIEDMEESFTVELLTEDLSIALGISEAVIAIIDSDSNTLCSFNTVHACANTYVQENLKF